MSLRRAWLVSGPINPLWGNGDETYNEVPYALLPPLASGLDGTFAFLRSPGYSGAGLEFEEQEPDAIEGMLEARIAEAASLGLRIPSSFRTLLVQPELYRRIPSTTSCYLDLGTRFLPVPGAEAGVRALRFLNDQQGCAFWYLLLATDGSHSVISADAEWSPDELKAMGGGQSLDDGCSLVNVAVCANSFEEFVQRFWLDNVLWLLLRKCTPLPEGILSDYERCVRIALASRSATTS